MKLLIKALLLFVYVLIASEFFLRLFSPVPMLPRYIGTTTYGIRMNQPNSEYMHKTPDYKVHFKINSKGIRADREIPYQKPSGTKRIVILGGSFGMGYGVELKDTFSETVSRILSDKGIKNEVINLSVSGFSNAEELLTLTNEGLKYEPDLVILGFHYTDFTDNVRSKLFKIENDSLVRDAENYLPAVKVREKLFSYPIYRWLAGNGHLYNWLRDKAAGKVQSFLVWKNRQNIKKNNLAHNIKAKFQTNLIDENNSADYSINLGLAILKKIKNISENANAKLIILEIPMRIKRDVFSLPINNDLKDKLKEFYIISPLDEFQNHKGQLLYWENSNGHFTPLGCSIVGDVLSKFIVENNLLITADVIENVSQTRMNISD